MDMAPQAVSELANLSVDELVAIIQSQQLDIAVLAERNTELVSRISSLEEQLGLGGPPKSGCSQVPVIKASRPARENKPRKKRNLHFFRKREEPTKTLHHKPEVCPDCGRTLHGGGPKTSRQIIDIEFAPVVITEHVSHSRYCGVCKKRVVANPDLSGQAGSHRRFGHNLASLVATLSCEMRMPIRSIKNLLSCLYGLRISEGAITDLLQQVARSGSPVIDRLRADLQSAEFLHVDESSWRESGQNGFLWSQSTPDIRLFDYDRHRSHEVAKRIIGLFVGILVTDFYYAYNLIESLHQRCWVHFLRALHDLREGSDESVNIWIDSVIAVWQEAVDFQTFCRSNPKFGSSIFDRKRKRKELERKLYALAEPYLDCDPKQIAQTTLSKRTAMFLSELFTFVEYPQVPHHNNPAEQAIRPAVITRKISGGTRSPLGTETKMTLMSLFATWKLRGLDPIQQCRQILIASP